MSLMKFLLYQLEQLMKIYVPEVYIILASKEVPFEAFSIQWYLSLFSCDFDLNNLSKLWDLFFIFGWKFLHQVSLVTLKHMRESIKKLSHGKLMAYVRSALAKNLVSKVKLFVIFRKLY